jgi:hypothetical protein
VIAAEYFQYLAGFPVGAFMQNVGGFGVDLHAFFLSQRRQVRKEKPVLCFVL